MSVITTSRLSPTQVKEVQTLLAASLSFPLEDAELFTLYCHDGQMLAAAAFVREDEETFECCAYTSPAVRHQGLFSAMLDAALDILPAEVSLVFYTDGTCPDTIAVLHALDAEWISDEYMMEYTLSAQTCTVRAESQSQISTHTQHPSIALSCIEQEEEDGSRLLHYESNYGTVYILSFSSYYYLYGFEIWEPHRNQGYGTILLHQVLSDLASHNPLPVRLQVSGENHPALALYKKTGFRITETLSCYLY